MTNPRAYRGRVLYALPLFLLPTIFFLAALGDSSFNSQETGYLPYILYLPFFAVFLIPLGYKLEIHTTGIVTKFYGRTIADCSTSQVEKINYGPVGMFGGVYSGTNASRATPYGNGLAILMNNKGSWEVIGISEKLYGKQAIEDVKNILGHKVN